MEINITSSELTELLNITPANQNIMLVGRHGIGKSEILTDYFTKKGMKVVALFLGQMSDPGDLIGLPHYCEKTRSTEFMPPYWFPKDNTPIVLFLDELNRARPEVLQTIMDLALNRTLAGKRLPKGSRIISAVNAGEQYQLTDLDPALVSRFNIYHFSPTSEEWLLWAIKNKLDSRIVSFIQEEPLWLDNDNSHGVSDDTGLDKTPDRRAWKKVSDMIKDIPTLDAFHKKVIAGIVGVGAASAFCSSAVFQNTLSGKDVLMNFDSCKDKLKTYRLHELSVINESIFRTLETTRITTANKNIFADNLTKYTEWIATSDAKEAMAYLVSVFESKTYYKAQQFIVLSAPKVFNLLVNYVDEV